MEIALIENIQRRDLNPIEEALAYRSLINEYNLKQDELAKRVSKSRAAIANSMRLLRLAERFKMCWWRSDFNGTCKGIAGIRIRGFTG